MTDVNRRQFLVRSTATAGAIALPSWLAAALGAQDPADGTDGSARTAALVAATRRARAHGKPLLVLLFPEDQSARWQRGELFGAWLNHADDEALRDLALCVPACATAGELRSHLAVKIDGDPLMLLVDPARDEVVPIAPELAEAPPRAPMRSPRDGAEERYYRDCVARLSAAVRRAVAPNLGWLAERADRQRATLAEDEREALDRAMNSGTADPGLLVRAAAVVRIAAAAPRRAGDGERLLAALADASRQEIVQPHLPGAKWAHSGGCGMRIEGERDNVAVGCGMGHVPELAQRFLFFYSE